MMRWLMLRFPPLLWLIVLVPLGSTFALYHGVAHTRPPAFDVLGFGVTAVLLFAQLRLIDDIVDCEADHPTHRSQTQRRLAYAFVAALVVMLALNPTPRTVLLIVFADVCMVALAAHYARNDSELRLVHEPSGRIGLRELAYALITDLPSLLILALPYVVWADRANPEKPLSHPQMLIVSVTVSLWASYLFWKYGRRWKNPQWRPYGLSFAQFRGFMACLVALWTFAQCWSADVLGVDPFVQLGVLGFGLALIALLPSAERSVPPRGAWVARLNYALIVLGTSAQIAICLLVIRT